MRQYWFGMRGESRWAAGSAWKLVSGDGQAFDAGEFDRAERIAFGLELGPDMVLPADHQAPGRLGFWNGGQAVDHSHYRGEGGARENVSLIPGARATRA